VTQLLWADILAFIWDRFSRYRQQKTQVDQGEPAGRKIKLLADQSASAQEFITLHLIGVRYGR
jgi:hypothetical protein